MSAPQSAGVSGTYQDDPPSPHAVMELSTGLWAAKTLSAGVDLGLFEYLSAFPGKGVDEVASGLALPRRSAQLLLTACASLGLLRREGSGYRNEETAEHYLIADRPYSLTGWIALLDRSNYAGWMGLSTALRTGRPTTWDSDTQESLFDNTDPSARAAFWAGMDGVSRYTATRLGKAVDLSGVTRLLDVGGGGGAYATQLCRMYPGLTVTVYDLPFVCEITADMVADSGVAERVLFAPGDFFADQALPGMEAVLLSMVLHDWDEQECLSILRKCHAALPSGGQILISELLLDDSGDGPVGAALMSLNMLVETAGGRNYARGEYCAWLDSLGFVDVRVVDFHGPGSNGVVIGVKP
jgi:3-hydroxy-5-methyl-1-naphthoate 3-O-methyltransferase